ncbi:MAG TPA: hypothetical protein VEQ42_02380, partial [Pyrinomonadaceae bacterium]|nr:hypothetical protein [Pyrinomonadaceae bacterium]
ILLMIYVLNRMLFKPVNRVLDERERLTRGRSGEAHEILSSVESKLTNYERALREARTQSYQLLEQERAEAMRGRQAQLDEVRGEVTRSIEEEKGAIHAQAEAARATLEEEARRVAATVSAQILGRPVGESLPPGTRF